mmetsp:Transcript_39536/g.46212  ORF Transcript_39536/g.46212 Transcript_39536/m.46212 type:complete len:631 (-) Transcript_39536:262-2154(-)
MESTTENNDDQSNESKEKKDLNQDEKEMEIVETALEIHRSNDREGATSGESEYSRQIRINNTTENDPRPGAYEVNQPTTNARIYRARERQQSRNNDQMGNENNDVITSATLVEELMTADATDIPCIIPTAIPDDDVNHCIMIKYQRSITFVLLGIVGISILVWRMSSREESNDNGTIDDMSTLITRNVTINSLSMTMEGVLFDYLDSGAILDWENTTSHHIKLFYSENKKNLKIDVVEARTIVTNTGDSYVEYNQEFQIESELDDTTSAVDLAMDPFATIYDGKQLYASALQRLGGVFENITTSSYITINFMTSLPSDVLSTTVSQIYSALPPVTFENSLLQTGKSSSVVFPMRNFTESGDFVWKAKGDRYHFVAGPNVGKVVIWKSGRLFEMLLGKGDQDNFGTSVTISADARVLAVGVLGTSDKLGSVFLFDRLTTDKNFVRSQQLNGTEFSYNFGYTLAMTPNGNILAVSAPYMIAGFSSTYIFQRLTIEEKFTFHQQLRGSELSSNFGHNLYMASNGIFLVASADLIRNITHWGPGLVTLLARSNTNELFEVVHEILGECEDEWLGYYGVAVSATVRSILVHAKGRGCNDNNTVRSYQIHCSCKNEDFSSPISSLTSTIPCPCIIY